MVHIALPIAVIDLIMHEHISSFEECDLLAIFDYYYVSNYVLYVHF